MANYYLSTRSKNINFTKINFTKIAQFSHLKYSLLKDVDTFTMQFTSKKALKQFLIKQELVNANNVSLCISYRYNGKENVLYSDIALYDDKDYLNYDFIIEYTKKAIWDIDFLNKLHKKYKKKYENNIHYGYKDYKMIFEKLEDINRFLCMVSNNEHIYDTTRYNLYVSLQYLFQSELINAKSKTINYRELHDLGMFISKHEKSIQKKGKTKVLSNQISLFDLGLTNK